MTETKRRRGFAAMKPELQRELSSKGGRAGGHRFTPGEARKAGQKGGRGRAAARKKQEAA